MIHQFIWKPHSFSKEKVWMNDEIDIDDLSDREDLTVSEVVETLQKCETNLLEKGWKDITISIYKRYDSLEWAMEGLRMETDKEFNTRLDEIEVYQAHVLKDKRRAYEELKKEF